jgi:hypothetical protein
MGQMMQQTYQPGMGHMSTLPPEIGGWNWGAFVFTWIWGIFNGSLVTLWGLLIGFIPFGGLVWAIVCGTKGNEWAWRGKQWQSAEHFKRTQHKWAIAALIFVLVVIALVILSIVLSILFGDTTTTTDTYYYDVILPFRF